MRFTSGKGKLSIIPGIARCSKCHTRYDLEVLRTRKGYKPGICPACGGYLKSGKERTY